MTSDLTITTLVEKQTRIQQAISFLEEGLKNHFAFEEKALPLLFGELLMKSILYEHHEISRQIESAKTILANIKLEALSQAREKSQLVSDYYFDGRSFSPCTNSHDVFLRTFHLKVTMLGVGIFTEYERVSGSKSKVSLVQEYPGARLGVNLPRLKVSGLRFRSRECVPTAEE